MSNRHLLPKAVSGRRNRSGVVPPPVHDMVEATEAAPAEKEARTPMFLGPLTKSLARSVPLLALEANDGCPNVATTILPIALVVVIESGEATAVVVLLTIPSMRKRNGDAGLINSCKRYRRHLHNLSGG